MMKLVLKIAQALILSITAVVILLNSELSRVSSELEAKKLNLNPSVSLAEPLR